MSQPVSDAFNFSRSGAWGPITSTLDFCEANYQFSKYVAEMANAFSNIITVWLALHGANKIREQGLPSRYLFGFLSLAVVGIGSFAFHATLLHTAQLSDELPMVYTASCAQFILLDTARGFSIRGNRKSQLLLFGILFVDILFTYSYWMYRNPIYHQVVFAGIMLFISARGVWLLHFSEASANLDAETRRTIGIQYNAGAGTFVLGFVIWNLDNVFCDALSRWKASVTWPAAFFMEGHSWWHVFTAYGTYLMWIGTTYL
ncbi:alkaline phytoceramidase [Phellopilus nigrolimitatus]|nr:alkaline phytoceramidase [Phellopilus nigrolimitatus]